MSRTIINMQAPINYQLNGLSSNAHKILFGLLAQDHNPITGALEVKISDLYRSLYPERKRVSRHFKSVLDQALIELETYPLKITVDQKWKGFRKLSARGLISIDPQGIIHSNNPQTIISYLDKEYMIEGTIIIVSKIQKNKVTMRFNPILLEFFSTSDTNYTKINVVEIASLKKRLSPRLLELMPPFKAIAHLSGSSCCFEWSWRGETTKVPSVLKALANNTPDNLDHLFPDRIEPALKEMVEYGYLQSYVKKAKSPKRIQSILLFFPMPVPAAQPPQNQPALKDDDLPF